VKLNYVKNMGMQTQPETIDKQAILDQSRSVLPAELVEIALTSFQCRPDAEAKMQPPASSVGRRRIRDGFSSSNSKIIYQYGK
jgi:hypothetical protein